MTLAGFGLSSTMPTRDVAESPQRRTCQDRENGHSYQQSSARNPISVLALPAARVIHCRAMSTT
jgi:hypothetical protein